MPRVARVRADVLLLQRGLASSRERARALILAGQVFCAERRVDKAGEQLAEDAPLRVRGDDNPYVSRGGLKLVGALDTFALDPAGQTVADFGASTGGFTDCVLQRGARHVYAIDVGYGQLHPKLRSDARVTVMERTNARHLTATDLPQPVDWVVIDASFIGLEKLLPAAREVLVPRGVVVALVKPQFQLGREAVSRTAGVVRDEGLRQQAIADVSAAAEALGFRELGRADAAVKGPKGNQECFLWLTVAGSADALLESSAASSSQNTGAGDGPGSSTGAHCAYGTGIVSSSASGPSFDLPAGRSFAADVSATGPSSPPTAQVSGRISDQVSGVDIGRTADAWAKLSYNHASLAREGGFEPP